MALAAIDVLFLLWGSRAGGNVGLELAAVLCAHAAGLGALFWLALDRRLAATPLAWVLLAALALRLAAVAATPLLEDDHHRYLWDGLRTATALDPYRLPPEAFFGDGSLAPQWQAVLSGINHPELPTIYGPLLQGLFALAWWIAPAKLGPLQGLLLAFDMAVLVALARWRVDARWLWVYALHPLVFKEALASAHPDSLVALLLMGAAWSWQQGRAVRVGLWLGAACAAKVAALVVLPLLWLAPGFACAAWPRRASWAARAALGTALAVILAYLPFLVTLLTSFDSAGGSDLPSLLVFARQWHFNPLLYRAVELVAPDAARPIAALALVTVVAVLARWLALRRDPGAIVPAMAWALLALLLLAPVHNPWYGLWLLPLAVAARQSSGVVLTAVSVLSYLNGHLLPDSPPAAPFFVPWSLTLLQLAAVAAALVWDLRGYGMRDHSARVT